MAGTKQKPTTVRLTDAQRAWLERQEAETGNDASATIRFLIAAAMRGPVAPAVDDGMHYVQVDPAEVEARRVRAEAERKERERQAKIAAKRAELEALERGEDPDAPTEMYGDDPYTAEDKAWRRRQDLEGRLRERAERDRREAQTLGLPIEPVDEDPDLPFEPAPVALKGPAFSLTAPAGLNADLRKGSVIGDAKGNILRENFKWMDRR